MNQKQADKLSTIIGKLEALQAQIKSDDPSRRYIEDAKTQLIIASRR